MAHATINEEPLPESVLQSFFVRTSSNPFNLDVELKRTTSFEISNVLMKREAIFANKTFSITGSVSGTSSFSPDKEGYNSVGQIMTRLENALPGLVADFSSDGKISLSHPTENFTVDFGSIRNAKFLGFSTQILPTTNTVVADLKTSDPNVDIFKIISSTKCFNHKDEILNFIKIEGKKCSIEKIDPPRLFNPTFLRRVQISIVDEDDELVDLEAFGTFWFTINVSHLQQKLRRIWRKK